MNQVKNSIKQKMDLSFSTLPKDSDIVMIMKEQRIKKNREGLFSLPD